MTTYSYIRHKNPSVTRLTREPAVENSSRPRYFTEVFLKGLYAYLDVLHKTSITTINS